MSLERGAASVGKKSHGKKVPGRKASASSLLEMTVSAQTKDEARVKAPKKHRSLAASVSLPYPPSSFTVAQLRQAIDELKVKF